MARPARGGEGSVAEESTRTGRACGAGSTSGTRGRCPTEAGAASPVAGTRSTTCPRRGHAARAGRLLSSPAPRGPGKPLSACPWPRLPDTTAPRAARSHGPPASCPPSPHPGEGRTGPWRADTPAGGGGELPHAGRPTRAPGTPRAAALQRGPSSARSLRQESLGHTQNPAFFKKDAHTENHSGNLQKPPWGREIDD